jgi:hypothetical protein
MFRVYVYIMSYINNNICTKHPIHYGSSLQNINVSQKYGSNWIINSNSLNSNKQYQLHPTKN